MPPQLRQRYSVLATARTVNFLWSLWHLPLFLLTSGDSAGRLDFPVCAPALVFCLVLLPTYRTLMVWVYERTKSVLMAILLHASLAGGVAMILIPLDAEGWPSLSGTSSSARRGRRSRRFMSGRFGARHAIRPRRPRRRELRRAGYSP